MSKTHIQVWTGSHSVNVIDLTNAGKVGKTCRQYYFCGDDRGCKTMQGFDYAYGLIGRKSSGVVELSYDEVVAALDEFVLDAKFLESPYKVSGEQDTIRGVDAPLPIKEHHADAFSLTLDKDGVHLADILDHNNCPRVITNNQVGRVAYAKAAKVWEVLVQCKSFSEAWETLSGAGCRLHYYCAMD